MTAKTPEDMTDPTGIGERAPTKEAPIIPFEQAVMLRLDAIVAQQKDQSERLDKLLKFSNRVIKSYEKEVRALTVRVTKLEQAIRNGQ